MKTKSVKMDWWIPVLGIGTVAGFLVAANTYRPVELLSNAEADLVPTLDRLCWDYTLSQALKTLHEGKVDEAALSLDLVLCCDILRTDAELASADAQTKAWGEHVFRRIARFRPKTAKGVAAASALVSGGIRADAERVLERALAADQSDRTALAGR